MPIISLCSGLDKFLMLSLNSVSISVKNFIFITFPVDLLMSCFHTIDASQTFAVPNVSLPSTYHTTLLEFMLELSIRDALWVSCEVDHKSDLRRSIIVSAE